MSKLSKHVVLVILDGWGLGEQNESNPIHLVKPTAFEYLKTKFPAGALQASGAAVGLPWGEEGNSEVGHLTIGAGKIIYQHLPRINMAVENGSFYKNIVLAEAIDHVQKNNSALHLAGLLSQGNVHASIEHLLALIKTAQEKSVQKINLHLFSDGKDSPQKSFLKLLESLDLKSSNAKLASISGRYYAMDRDKHWDRTEVCYKTLTGQVKNQYTENVEILVKNNYQEGLTDEYIRPTLFGDSIKNGDALIFFNYREDSIRQIFEPFINPDFKNFKTAPLNNIFIASMTKYGDHFPNPVFFPPEKIINPLGKVLADHQKKQLRIAETEKYAHVTYFFNGLQDAPQSNEYRVLVPSQTIAHHEDRPEMMASEITNRAVQAIEDGQMDFILINYANPDVIAHTGNYEASIKAIMIINQEINKLVKTVLNQENVYLLITADHGNIEQMINPATGLPEAKHNISPVPIYLVSKGLEKEKNALAIERSEREPVGILADVAPTILELMEIPKPTEMTGESLVNRLN